MRLPGFLTGFLEAVPWFAPGLIAWTVTAVLATRWVSRFVQIPRPVALFLLVALGFALLATLTPTSGALDGRTELAGSCDLRRVTIAPIRELIRANDASGNVALFVPLGIALGLCPLSRRMGIVIALAFLLPVLIELLQLAFPSMGRGCQSADVVDNAMGLAIGLGIGTVARLAVARRF